MKIIDIHGREILDSRGNPTVEVDLSLENGIKVTASVPSGASTGSREALELRDQDANRYHGKGVLKAVSNINDIIRPHLIGVDVNQAKTDQILIDLDGTSDKSKLGANAMLAVSLATLKAAAVATKKELYEYISDGKVSLPIPMINILNGGAHADNDLAIQEFMIVPVVKTFAERLRVGAEIFHTLKGILKKDGHNTNVGDEGGFAPNLQKTEEALSYLVKAIKESGYVPGKDVFIALDSAASEFYDKEKNVYHIDGVDLSPDDLVKYYIALTSKYPILSIEDPFDENDWESFAVLTRLIGNHVMLVGDDYFVTNKKCLEEGIRYGAGNAILLKANQIGTISEMVQTMNYAEKNRYKMIISHRSGETEDTFIADFAVGLHIPYIKIGSLSRGERIAKYNRLLRIEEKLRH